jgi:hypothetical protein
MVLGDEAPKWLEYDSLSGTCSTEVRALQQAELDGEEPKFTDGFNKFGVRVWNPLSKSW